MSGIVGLLNTGRQALLAHQLGIAVTGNNIANVNTPGYTRQDIELRSDSVNFGRLGSLGTGVEVARFLRDRGIFQALRQDVLPVLAERARAESRALRCWSAGCASGEEPYSLVIAARLGSPPLGVPLDVVAMDIDPQLIARARRGVFPAGALRELPEAWRARAFEPAGDESAS